MGSSNTIYAQLKEKGYRLTPQRMEVVKIVLEKLEQRSHPTFNDILAEVKRRMPSISSSTVYSILKLLEENGLITSFEHSGRTYYDKTDPHINVICINSNKILDINDEEINQILKRHGVEPVSISVRGICSD